MEAEVVKEYTTEGGRHIKEMSDGRILVSEANAMRGTQYGTVVMIRGEVTEEKLSKAKEMAVEDVCRIIREVASVREDFFIIKQAFTGDGTSVGHKFILPTVEEDGFSRFKEELIVE
jgi:hypothetical protein